jgi:hypothetical protein
MSARSNSTQLKRPSRSGRPRRSVRHCATRVSR